MKKILLISAFVPSRKTAGQNYTRQLIEDLSGRYEVDLICFRNRSEAEGIAVPDTNMLKCIVVDKKDKLFNALKLPFLHPIFTARFQWSVVRYIRKNKHRYDALIFNFGQVFAYALFAGHSRKIVITHDVMIQKFSRQKNIFGYLENRFVKSSERLLYKTATLIFCHSPKDETLIRNIYGVKAHHNVGGLPDDLKFDLVEPLRLLFKDEVRQVGAALGLPDSMVYRQPFPGPGLGVRCLGAITRDRLEAVRESDAILREEFAKNGLEGKVWQYFTAIPDIKSVGVRDNKRADEWCVIIRAVNTVDAMTATVENVPFDLLQHITARITAEVKGVNRVLFDLTPKPTGTIEWE